MQNKDSYKEDKLEKITLSSENVLEMLRRIAQMLNISRTSVKRFVKLNWNSQTIKRIQKEQSK